MWERSSCRSPIVESLDPLHLIPDPHKTYFFIQLRWSSYLFRGLYLIHAQGMSPVVGNMKEHSSTLMGSVCKRWLEFQALNLREFVRHPQKRIAMPSGKNSRQARIQVVIAF